MAAYAESTSSSLTQLFRFDNHMACFLAIPAYFNKFGPKERTDRLQTIFAFGEGELGSTAWEIIHNGKSRMMTFTPAMASSEDVVPGLGTCYLSCAVEEAAKPDDRALVVDVGGERGRRLRLSLEIRLVYPETGVCWRISPRSSRRINSN